MAPAVTRRLAYLHIPSSFSWMTVLTASRDLCDLIWVIDDASDDRDVLRAVMRRSGPVVDITGMDAVTAAAAIAEHAPDGILTLADTRLALTAEIAAELGLAALSAAAARALTDKWAQREALAAGGVPTPGHWQVPAADDWGALDRFWAQVSFPAILKPRRGEASRDTVKVDSAADLRRELAAVGDVRGAGEALVLEEYIPDRPEDLGQTFAGYVSVESITSHGESRHLAITGRFPPAPPFRESGFFMPSALSEVDAEQVMAMATAAITAVGVDIGCCHTEVKLTPDGPRVIEVNGRIGGGVPEMLLDMSGYDLMKQALLVALGDRLEADVPLHPDEVAYLFYVQAPAGMREVHAVDGLNELKELPGVNQVILNRGPGRQVDWREGNHGHVFSVRGVAASHDELSAFARALEDRVEVRGE
jgi:biotin carboxylase